MRLGDKRISKLFIENQEIGDEERNGRQQEREKRLWTVHGEKEKEEEEEKGKQIMYVYMSVEEHYRMFANWERTETDGDEIII